jgi:hypothetical protein
MLSYRYKVKGGEGQIPAGSLHTGEEDTSVSVLVCDVYSSMGVVGYGTTGCARTGTYTLGLSPLPSTTGILGPENPIFDPAADPFILDVIFLGLYNSNFSDSRNIFTATALGAPVPANNIAINSGILLFGQSTLKNNGIANDGLKYDVQATNPLLKGNYSLLIEGFFYPLSFPTSVNYFYSIQDAGTNQQKYAYMNAAGTISWNCNGVSSSIGTASLNRWNYFAVLYNPVNIQQGVRRIWFSNGTTSNATLIVNAASQVSAMPYVTTSRLGITGRDFGAATFGQQMHGYISNIRITASSTRDVNRYGSSATIPVPTEPFPIY